MSWSSGTKLVEEISHAIKTHVTDGKTRKALYQAVVFAAEDLDWDGHDEVTGIDPILDGVVRNR